MTERDFLDKFIELTDTDDEVTMITVLDDLVEWDSLSIVSFIAMANANCGVKVKLDDVKAASTVKELYKLIG